eukprot:TRINITY_DN16350_c0_g1_i1.p2 TRINITY_DN16350_c0_g1~~TRINITY_DN16350_c0_g1_i1.p2  ORF type:complete len:108 (+),score=20.85 TRINITY_DN16350_c0_g1_i1:94-417(+)
MASPSPQDSEDDLLAEAEALGIGGEDPAAEGVEEGETGEDLSGPADGDSSTEPKFAVGQALRLQQSEGVFKACTVVAADKTDMGPMYAVRFEDGHVQSLVPETDLLL